MMEKWLPVAGFAGKYEVSDHGRVRSFGRKSPNGALLVGRSSPRGYRYFNLCSEGKRVRTYSLHRLVLEAFVGPRPNGLVCCHWDGNPKNNMLSNLRWDTQVSNKADSRRHGTLRGAKAGEGHHLAKLWDDAIRVIRAEPKFHGVQKMLAEAFDVSPALIRGIRKGIGWEHVVQ